MENTTPLSLDREIQQWRAELAQSPVFKPENLNELESHLRDSVATLQQRGLSEEESFLIATRRIGRGGALQSEFGKINAKEMWLQRALWMLIGVQLWQTVSLAVFGIGLNGMYHVLRRVSFGTWQFSAALFCVVQLVGTFATLWICWYLVVKKGTAIGRWFRRIVELRGRPLAGLIALFFGIGGVKVFNWALTAARMRLEYSDPKAITASYNFSNVFMWGVQVAIFVTLIFILARKTMAVRHQNDVTTSSP
jgi:hypothetical protein